MISSFVFALVMFSLIEKPLQLAGCNSLRSGWEALRLEENARTESGLFRPEANMYVSAPRLKPHHNSLQLKALLGDLEQKSGFALCELGTISLHFVFDHHHHHLLFSSAQQLHPFVSKESPLVTELTHFRLSCVSPPQSRGELLFWLVDR